MASRVLVCDDAPGFGLLLESVFAGHGFDVVGLATSWPEAVELAAATTPDVVLLDLWLPTFDRDAVTRVCEAASGALVAVVSSLAADEAREQVAGIAAIDLVLSKRDSPDALVDAVRAALAARDGGPEFFFGAMSPYSWFAAERIGALLPDALWRPVFAGGLFKAAGRTSWGLTDARAAGLADCEARARQHGLGPIRWPDPWPTNDLLVARAMVVAEAQGVLQAFALAAMRLAFTESAELGRPEVVEEAARRAGLDPAAILEAAGSDAVKAEARARTEAASARGIFGVPTVAIGEALFWGDDRLEEAASAKV